MADLAPLIRYQKYQLDEKQRFIARLYAEAEKVFSHKARLLDELKNERVFSLRKPILFRKVPKMKLGTMLAKTWQHRTQ